MAETTTPQKMEQPETLIETGVDQNLPFSSPYSPKEDGTGRIDSEVRLQEVGREGWTDEGPTVRQLVTMRKMDGQARALYRLLTLPIRSALNTATFVPAEGGEKEAEFIEAAFLTPSEAGGMSVTFQRFMSQMLQALFDGFAAFEKVYWVPETGPLKGKVTLRKLAHRPSETVTFLTSENGSFKGLRQQAVVAGKTIDTFIPRDYAFYYASQEEERKFYGVSFFQSAFYHYDKKVKLYYTAHLAAQRAAVGTRVGTVPSNASDTARRQFSQSLANMSVAQWMTVPENFKVDILKEGGSFDFLSLINHHNSQMSKSLLANFFDSNEGGGKSDTALVNFAQPGDEMFVLMLRAVMDDIADQINHYIIPPLIDLNFKKGRYPKFTWGSLTDEQRAAIAKIFDKIVAAGQSVNLPKEFTRALEKQMAEEMGLEIDWDAVEEREAKEAEEAAAMQNAQMGLGADGQPLPAAEGGETPPEGEPIPGEEGAEEDSAPLTAEDLGLEGDWTLEDFEDALAAYQGGEEPEDEEVELSAEDLGLTGAWTLEDFENALADYQGPEEDDDA